MRIIFCSDYWNPQSPDEAYRNEAEIAHKLGLHSLLISFEALEQGNITRAIRRITATSNEGSVVYRGWMIKQSQYERLYAALAEKGLKLINTPEAYKHCHYLPESYHVIEEMTPRTVWLKTNSTDFALDDIMNILSVFGDQPIIVKDFVKSQKHHWDEACYIPHASDRNVVEKVVTRFLQLQGDDLNEGLVFREFLQFEPLTTHSKSGMPLTKEYRLFVLDRRIIATIPYWDEGNYGLQDLEVLPPTELFSEVAGKVESRFFTMDVARGINGRWYIVELGDGQVAGLPTKADIAGIYRILLDA